MRPEALNARRVFGARSLLMIVAVAGMMVTLFAAAPAQAQASGTQDWLNRINSLRTSHGLNALILDSNLSDLAQQRADTNERTGQLVHTPNLALGVTSNWGRLAENIGAGQDHEGLWQAFLHSPSHLENLLDPTFTHVGIGENSPNPGNDWVTHRFMRLNTTPAGGSNGATAGPVAVAQPATQYVVPRTVPAPTTTARSTANTNANRSSGATSGATTSAAPASGGGSSSPPPDGASSDPRSPAHVAAVVNVLKFLEQ
jgi:hypothetical protein